MQTHTMRKGQGTLRFTFPHKPGELKVNQRLFEQWFNEFVEPVNAKPHQLLAQLLKRQARLVLYDISTCNQHLIPSNVGRIRDLLDVFSIAFRLCDTEEANLPGLQFQRPETLADYQACLERAAHEHRSPVTVANDDVLQRLDIIAWHVAQLAGNVQPTNEQPKTESGVAS